MSISPKANCNFSLSLASFAFVLTCSSFSSYYNKQDKEKISNNKQSLKQVPCSCPGQVNLAAQLSDGQGPGQVVCQLNQKKSKLRHCNYPGQENFVYPKSKLEYVFFFQEVIFVSSMIQISRLKYPSCQLLLPANFSHVKYMILLFPYYLDFQRCSNFF